MRCERCHGLGRVLVDNHGAGGAAFWFGAALPVSADGAGIEALCPECNGSGIAHCCDGLCAQALADVGTDVVGVPTR
jgi:hypothetical protein